MKKYFEVLNKVALFYGMDGDELLSLLECLGAKVEAFDRNETVFMSGDVIYRFGIVLSGQVQVISEDFYGNRNILAAMGAGEMIGESYACAESYELPVSVVATADSELLFIDFRRLASPCVNACAFHARLIRNMLNIVSVKNIALTRKIEHVSRRTTREKLLSYLSDAAKKAGGGWFSIPFNRQELADYLYVERSAMSATLSKLRDEGVLLYHRNNFKLL